MSNEEPTGGAVDWELIDALGGPEALDALIRDFYERVFSDAMIGFFFLPHDIEHLVDHQRAYICARLGRTRTRYHGKTMRQAHDALPILGPHFDRRHVLLRQTLEDHQAPAHVRDAWLDLDQRLRPFIVRMGKTRRDALLS